MEKKYGEKTPISTSTNLIFLPPVGGVLLELGHRLGELVDLGFEVLEALAVGSPTCLQFLHLQLKRMFSVLSLTRKYILASVSTYLVDLCLLLKEPDSLLQVPRTLPLEQKVLRKLQSLLGHVRLDLSLLNLGFLHLQIQELSFDRYGRKMYLSKL